MKRTRPRDSIHQCESGVPRMPAAGTLGSESGVLLLACAPRDLDNGQPRVALAWDPGRCARGIRGEIRRLVNEAQLRLTPTPEEKAIWEYLQGGPDAVTNWDLLSDRFKRLTRAELGLIAFPASSVLLFDPEEGAAKLPRDESADDEEEEEGVRAD